MIEFKNLPYRDKAIIYQTTLEQIKKIYIRNPQQAGELAIAAIEVALSGEHSSDDYMIDIILEQSKFLSIKNQQKYDKKVDTERDKRIQSLQLNEIVNLLEQGFNQSQIAAKLKVSRQTISKRVGIIHDDFPELLSTCQVDIENCQEEQVDEVDNIVDNLSVSIDCQDENDGHFVNRVNLCHSNNNINNNINNNDNTELSSDEESFPSVPLSELNRLGVSFIWLDGETIQVKDTGKIFRVEI